MLRTDRHPSKISRHIIQPASTIEVARFTYNHTGNGRRSKSVVPSSRVRVYRGSARAFRQQYCMGTDWGFECGTNLGLKFVTKKMFS